MKQFVPTICLLLAFSVTAWSQTGRPTPPADQDVVKIETNVIQLDVTVTDKKGNPITDLRRDEIEIFENGRKKEINGFSFVSGGPVSSGAPRPAKGGRIDGRLPLPPSGPVRPEAVRRTVAIVVDDLSLSFSSTFWVKEALKKYIREQIQEGDLVAIIKTGSAMGTLQQFTTDRRLLLSAADRIKWATMGSGGISSFPPVRSGLAPNSTSEDPNVEQLRDSVFASGTIGTLNFVIRGMRELPGRKSVILLTDGINIFTRDSRGRPQFSLTYHALRRMIDNANRSAVTFYPIQAEGLTSIGFSAEDDFIDMSLIGGERVTEGIISGRLNRVKDVQDGLRFLAEQTGGFAVVNSNDLVHGMRRAINDQSYYLVAYEPGGDTFDARKLRYNNIEIKVNRPEARVRYRSGFLNVSEQQSAAIRLSANDSIITALASPFRLSQIEVRMNALFTADDRREPVVNSYINIDPSGLTFTPAGGETKKTSFDIVAYTFGSDGRVIDQRAKNFTLTVTPEQLRGLLERGLVMAFALPVKKPGGYQVRLAVHDTTTGHLGSASQFVEVPSVKSGRLLLSGLVLNSGKANAAAEPIAGLNDDPLRYTSMRQFRAGSTLHFSYSVYNPKLGADRKPRLVQSYKLFKDDQLVFSSTDRPVPIEAMPSPHAAGVSGGVVLGRELLPGDYILQIDINDAYAERRVTQFAQFEVVP